MKYPKYIKTSDGQIGTYAYLTFGNNPVYRFEDGDYKLRQATANELAGGTDNISDLQEQERVSMAWKQLSSTEWEAEGRFGKFRIERRRGKFWSMFASEDTAFNLPPVAKLATAKEMCQDNGYWE